MNQTYHYDVVRANQHREHLLQQAEMERLAQAARAGAPGVAWHRGLRARAGRLLVAVGTKLQEGAGIPQPDAAPGAGTGYHMKMQL